MSQKNATVICFCSAKGGCSKTTTCLNFGAGYLARKHKKVLFIDLDYQGNLTASLIHNLPNSKASNVKNSFIYRAFEHQADHTREKFPSNFKPVQVSKNTGLFASSPSLDTIPDLMRNKMTIAPYVLLTVFAKLDLPAHYDYILIDCHNSFTLTVQNALACADYCVSPITPSEYSLDSIATMIRKINQIKANLVNPITQKSLVTAKLLFIGQMIKYNTRNSHQFRDAIKSNKNFIAAFPLREIFNRATNSNVYDLADDEAKHGKRRNDQSIVANKITPEFDKMYKALGGK